MNESTLFEFQAVCENATGLCRGNSQIQNKSLLLRELNSIAGVLHAVKGGVHKKHLPCPSSESTERQRSWSDGYF